MYSKKQTTRPRAFTNRLMGGSHTCASLFSGPPAATLPPVPPHRLPGSLRKQTAECGLLRHWAWTPTYNLSATRAPSSTASKAFRGEAASPITYTSATLPSSSSRSGFTNLAPVARTIVSNRSTASPGHPFSLLPRPQRTPPQRLPFPPAPHRPSASARGSASLRPQRPLAISGNISMMVTLCPRSPTKSAV